VRFEIGMDPNLFAVGPFVMSWHGMFSVLAIYVAVRICLYGFAERGVQLGNTESFSIITIAGGIIGARVFYIVDHFSYFAERPLEVFAITEGGLAIYGAVIGGFLTVTALCLLRGLPYGQVIDSIAPGLAVGQAVGRIGCLINGDAWGARTDWPFAVTYTHPDALIPNRLLNEPTHPYPIYDMVMNAAIVAIIWRLRRERLPNGALFAVFSMLYAATRFLISYVREERVWFWGLQQAQVVALVVLLISTIAFIWLLRRGGGGSGTVQPAATPV
jgi:phosphatidylglycerol---prolipoprotein diacylglyceryl transferase